MGLLSPQSCTEPPEWEGGEEPPQSISVAREGDAAARRSEPSGPTAKKPIPLNSTSLGSNTGAGGVSDGGSPCLMPGPRPGSRMALPSQVTGRADLQKGKTNINTLEACVWFQVTHRKEPPQPV